MSNMNSDGRTVCGDRCDQGWVCSRAKDHRGLHKAYLQHFFTAQNFRAEWNNRGYYRHWSEEEPVIQEEPEVADLLVIHRTRPEALGGSR